MRRFSFDWARGNRNPAVCRTQVQDLRRLRWQTAAGNRERDPARFLGLQVEDPKDFLFGLDPAKEHGGRGNLAAAPVRRLGRERVSPRSRTDRKAHRSGKLKYPASLDFSSHKGG